MTYTDDVNKRMEAYGWHVQEIDGHNYESIEYQSNYENTSRVVSCTTDQ